MQLIEAGVKKIFYPCLPFNLLDKNHPNDNHYNCPVVASYAENIRGNMDILREENITFLQPFLPINDKKKLLQRFTEELKDENLPKALVKKAIDNAYLELEHYKQDVRDFAAHVIEKARAEHKHMIMLVN